MGGDKKIVGYSKLKLWTYFRGECEWTLEQSTSWIIDMQNLWIYLHVFYKVISISKVSI